MIRPDEVFAADITDAEKLTLCLPDKRNSQAILIAPLSNQTMAIVMDLNNHSFMAFPADGNREWGGAMVPDVSIEFDEKSLVDTSQYDFNAGTMVREGEQLLIAARYHNVGPGRSPALVPVLDGLPSGRERTRLGFSRWSIVKEDGEHRRVLLDIDSEEELIRQGQ